MALEPTSIKWLHQDELQEALAKCGQVRRPVLVDFHDPECAGCERLQASTYSHIDVINAVRAFTIPVRVITTNPDKTTEEIISRYLAISTPTVQLLSPTGTVDHCFRGAPRHTRLALSQWNSERKSLRGMHRRVYHEMPGSLPPQLFLSQLLLGRAKAALNRDSFQEAAKLFQAILDEHSTDNRTAAEAHYWSSLAASKTDNRTVPARGA